ncbi:hypothetical protein IRJ41_010502 [Triplophysa rosa]|uniref:Gypsy retrotransposon integrase-like protein 1 n=1 Tax=Triplophysa rosa TaxID=992332 RepID=A0A9W7T301_TRIRA|nr:hypothetical protein IRJ41_010502 [Triplophysa rosa]
MRVKQVAATSTSHIREDSSSSDDVYVFVLNTTVCQQQPQTHVNVNGTKIRVLIDSGAAVNIISRTVFNTLTPQPQLEPTATRIFAYGSDAALPISGVFQCNVQASHKSTKAKFYVLENDGQTLLSYGTAQELGLIDIIGTVAPQQGKRTVADELIDAHPELFEGIGTQKLPTELQKLEDDDIIETVTGPTPWVSPIVTPPKPKDPNKVRICVDMRQANTAIQRERHITPTIDDVIHDLNGANVFSKLDLRAGYHQLELHPDSQYITTFTTHLGLRRYKRLNFGISSAAEVFQNTIAQTLQGIRDVRNLSDDIIVYGVSQEAHDEALKAIFRRLKDSGLTLNRDKCEFNKHRLEFFGFIFSAAGISADPKKISAIQQASEPKDPTEIRSLLGMANYCSRFIKDFSTITAPLRELTKKGKQWQWTETHQKALQDLRNTLANATTMLYFDPSKGTELVVDASPDGQRHITVYASRALSDVEKCYSQTEREALAILWGCEHFHLYLYGSPFILVTDHKPLQPYHFSIQYRKGTDNPADFMSRHPVPLETEHNSRASKVAEEYVNFMALQSTPKAMTLDEIKTETKKDAILQQVCLHVRNNSWHTAATSTPHADTMKHYKNVCSELTVPPTDDLILRGSRIVIPKALEIRVLQLAHESQQGIAKTKSLLREKVWFPNMNHKVEVMINNCIACQATTPLTLELSVEPLKMSPLPEAPWHNVSADFYGPLPSGEYLLVIVDDYTRYPVIKILHSISATTVIPAIDDVFSMFGIPDTLKTDNGPPFNSSMKITPFWPQANATAERFMRTLGKAIRAAHVQGIPWKQQLNVFLHEYRSTPHSTTGTSPAELIFQRKVKTKIPLAFPSIIAADADIRQRDERAKAKMKTLSDTRRHATHSHIQPGDTVLCRQQKHTKLTMPYNVKPLAVTKVKGTMVTTEINGHSITRNSSFFKKRNLGTSDFLLDFENETEEIDVLDNPSRYPTRSSRRPPAHLSDYV